MLEGVAAGETGGREILDHVTSCRSCRTRLEQVRDSNALIVQLRAAAIRPPAAPPGRLEPGPIPGYEIVGEVYRGGQGVVYEALQVSTRRRVALKMLLSGTAATEREIGRFEREIEVVASLRHPNVVTLFESAVLEDGRRLFAMEFIDGERVDDYWKQVRRQGRAPTTRQVLGQFARICAAVAHAHQRGVIHRDLKPGNVLVDRDGVPHVVDFGLAKETDASTRMLSLTRSGEFVGSLLYAAPEQISSTAQPVDALSDVHALGLILFEMLTGTLPYRVDAPLSGIVQQIVQGERMPPSRLAGPRVLAERIPDDLDAIVLKAIDRVPLRRYASAAALAEDVERFLLGRPVEAKRQSLLYVLKKAVRRQRLLVFAVVVVTAAAAAFLTQRALDARRVARLLSQGNLERGRLMAAATDPAAAEEILWRELLYPPPGQAGADQLVGRELVGTFQAHFALWEFYRLYSCLRSFRVHDGSVLDMALLPGANRAVTLGADHAVRVHDLLDGRLVHSRQLIGACELAVNRQGTRIAVGMTDGRVVTFDVAGGGSALELEPHAEQVVDLAFHPRESLLASVGRDRRIRMHDLRTRTTLAELSDFEQPPLCIAFNADGSRLFAAILDRPIQQWRWTGEGWLPAEMNWEPSGWVRVIRTADDGARLGLAGVRRFSVADLPAGVIRSLPVVPRRSRFAFVGDGDRIAAVVGGTDHLRLLDARDGQLVRTLGQHQAMMTALAGGGDRVLVGDRDGALRIWDVRLRPELEIFDGARDGHRSTVHDLAIDLESGLLAAAGGADHTVTIRRVSSMHRSEARIELPCSLIRAVALQPGGQRIAASCGDGVVRIHDLRSLLCVGVVPARDKQVSDLAFTADGAGLVVADDAAAVGLFDLRTLEETRSFAGAERRVSSIALSPDSRWLAAADGLSNLLIWDLATGVLRSRTPGGSPISSHCIDWSPTGERLAVGGGDATIRLFDPVGGDELHTLRGHGSRVFSVCFSPDGRLLASGDEAGGVRLWEADTGLALLSMQVHDTAVFALRFAPDGMSLITSSSDHSIRRTDLTWYDRHIAGNLEFWIDRLGSNQSVRLRRWAERLER